jgi:hypothetical protein
MELSECDYRSAEVEMMRADGELSAQNTLNKSVARRIGGADIRASFGRTGRDRIEVDDDRLRFSLPICQLCRRHRAGASCPDR